MPNLTIRVVTMLTALSLVMTCAHSAAAESAAELISKFRNEHGEGRVTSDATLNRIASEQAARARGEERRSHAER